MKKLTAKILLVCILLLQSVLLIGCIETDSPSAGEPAAVILPTETEQTVTNTSPTPIKNVILIIGDGMGLDHIAAGQMMYQKQYAFTNWQFATSNTDSAYNTGKVDVTTATDSAAGATALASGQLAYRQTVGKDYAGKDVTTILDKARALGKATGIVTTDTLYGATPASFSAHVASRYDSSGIVSSQLQSGVNLLCGHIDSECTSKKSMIQSRGYSYYDNLSNVDMAEVGSKTYWQLDLGGSGAKVPLKDATVKALEFLDRDADGFAMMIEQAHVDKYAHNGDLKNTAWAVNSLNDTVDAILAWLGDRKDTAIVITADHETGGLSVSYENRYSKSMQSVARDADGYLRKIYYYYGSNDHTAAKVGVFVYGVKADFAKFSYYGSQHTIKNTNIYDLLVDILEHPADYAKSK